MPQHALRRALTAALTAVGALALGLASPAAHAAQPLPYAALGDSYSAATGVSPTDSTSPLCLRSTANYPHVIASRLGAALTDVSCGGAQTKDITASQYPGVGPQLDAVNASTRLVTLTIGGNDENTFIGALLACGTAGVATAGLGSPCKTLYGSTFDDKIDASVYPAVRSALQAVRTKAPQARVAILGYPWIVPAKAVSGCFAKLPIATGDVPYLRALQAHLNAVVARAAEETGSTFVDLSAVSDGHDACQASGTRWVEPVLFGSGAAPAHPNALGETKMAGQTLSTLGLG
jgi:lysophospholipase L1-like esterase